MKIKELQEQYDKQASIRKLCIKLEPNKFKRFVKWIWYLTTFPWVWCWFNLRDWRTFLIFIIVMLVVGCEVWIPLLLGIIFKNAWLLGVAAACEAFWLLPGTPFVILCICITIGVKEYDKRRRKK